jgi:hypothetical protein
MHTVLISFVGYEIYSVKIYLPGNRLLSSTARCGALVRLCLVLLFLVCSAGCTSRNEKVAFKSTEVVAGRDDVENDFDQSVSMEAFPRVARRELRFLRAPKIHSLDVPQFYGAHAIWGATGRDLHGKIFFGVAAYGVDDPSARLLQLDPDAEEFTILGSVNAQLEDLGIRRYYDWLETQMKIHSKIYQGGDGRIYFSSQDEHNESGDGSQNALFGGRLFAIDLRTGKWECVVTAPEGLIAVAAGNRYVCALGYFGHVIYRYDTKTRETKSIRLGTVGGHVSRNIFMDDREHIFAVRLAEIDSETGPGVTQVAGRNVYSTLVELDSDLNELRESPLEDYFPTLDTTSHGVTGFAKLVNGDIAFVTHRGALWLLPTAPGLESRIVRRLGWMHPDGPAECESLFSPIGERYLCGFGNRGQGYEWVVYDMEKGKGVTLKLTSEGQAKLMQSGLNVYGCDTLDNEYRAYVVGWKKVDGGMGPHVIQLSWE